MRRPLQQFGSSLTLLTASEALHTVFSYSAHCVFIPCTPCITTYPSLQASYLNFNYLHGLDSTNYFKSKVPIFFEHLKTIQRTSDGSILALDYNVQLFVDSKNQQSWGWRRPSLFQNSDLSLDLNSNLTI